MTMLHTRPRRSLLFLFVFAALRVASADVIQLSPQPKNPDKFQGIKTTGVINPAATYTVGNVKGVTTTKPLTFDSGANLEAQGAENAFLQTLFNFGNGWTFGFNTTAVLADNTFQVHTYQAQAPGPPASNVAAFSAYTGPDPFYKNCKTNNNCVGAEFYFGYNAPKGSDNPTDVEWIQVAYSNLNATSTSEFVVDNAGAQDPYYPTSNQSGLFDLSASNTPLEGNFADFVDFLVTGPPPDKPGLVTIYGAVEWGWSNTVPEPSSFVPLGIAALLLARQHRMKSSR